MQRKTRKRASEQQQQEEEEEKKQQEEMPPPPLRCNLPAHRPNSSCRTRQQQQQKGKRRRVSARAVWSHLLNEHHCVFLGPSWPWSHGSTQIFDKAGSILFLMGNGASCESMAMALVRGEGVFVTSIGRYGVRRAIVLLGPPLKDASQLAHENAVETQEIPRFPETRCILNWRATELMLRYGFSIFPDVLYGNKDVGQLLGHLCTPSACKFNNIVMPHGYLPLPGQADHAPIVGPNALVSDYRRKARIRWAFDIVKRSGQTKTQKNCKDEEDEDGPICDTPPPLPLPHGTFADEHVAMYERLRAMEIMVYERTNELSYALPRDVALQVPLLASIMAGDPHTTKIKCSGLDCGQLAMIIGYLEACSQYIAAPNEQQQQPSATTAAKNDDDDKAKARHAKHVVLMQRYLNTLTGYSTVRLCMAAKYMGLKFLYDGTCAVLQSRTRGLDRMFALHEFGFYNTMINQTTYIAPCSPLP